MKSSPASDLLGHVLVVEDNTTNRLLLVEMLKLVGCRVSSAANGVEALVKLQAERFDAVLMDWHMPQMDGVAATRELRNREQAANNIRHVPVIALTACILPGDRETCLQAGMDDFVAKPFTFEELDAVLRRWLRPQP